MSTLFNFIKKNLLVFIISFIFSLVLVLVFLFVYIRKTRFVGTSSSGSYLGSAQEFALPAPYLGAPVKNRAFYGPQTDYAGGESVSLNASNRKVKEDITISLKVEDVSQTAESIASIAKSFGGFVVNKSIRTKSKEGAPVSYSTVSVRVPKDIKEGFLLEAKKVGLEVVSESENLSDITDQYENIEEKLKLLQRNKARFEEIMLRATTVDEILRVQNQILSLQRQIDSLQGRKKYLEEVSKSVKITFYLSTDEYSLPYVPKDNWSLKAVFTKAVRSLVKNLRWFASALVWVVVYSPILLVLVLAYRFLKNKFKKS